jgi:hypothetical protein
VNKGHLLAALAAALAAGPARPATPLPGGLPDLAGPRALGLGACVGVASGNDGIFVNPGAVGARKRYSVETLYTLDRRGGTTVGQYLGGSVVDAISTPVAASAGYVRAFDGPQTGNLFVGGVAFTVAPRTWLGAQARWFSGSEWLYAPDGTTVASASVEAVTADAGLYWEATDLVSLGLAGYGLIPTNHDQALPAGVGAGLAVGSDTSVKVTGDWRADFDRRGQTTNRYAAGLELLLGRMVPVRGGWMKDETLGGSWWNAGAGLVTSGGVGLEVGYRQSLDDADARVVSVAFKLQFLEL